MPRHLLPVKGTTGCFLLLLPGLLRLLGATMVPRTTDLYETAVAHLSAADPILGELIAKVGPCGLKRDPSQSPFQALVQAVAHQQLHGKAAKTILSRFIALFPKSHFPTPRQVADVDITKLTAVGFSRAKASYVKEIARRRLEGLVPGRAEISPMADDEIVERLTQIKGVGRWTVEMLLIFTLGRPDVLPVHDFGIRTGFARVYRKRQLPKPKQLLQFGERWKPYRSIASWYLWRAVDLRNAIKDETMPINV